MNRLTSAAIAATAALIWSSTPAGAKPGSCSDPVVFGTTLSATGDLAGFAEKWRDMTIEFAREINRDGGIFLRSCRKKLPLQFIIYDDESKPETSVRMFERLATQDEVDFFVGPDWSSMGVPVAAVAAKYNIPTVMANVAASQARSAGRGNVWAVPMPTMANWSARYFDMMAKQTPKPETVLFVTQANAITRNITDHWIQGAERLGFKVIGYETFEAGQTDIMALVLKLRLRRPDIIYISAFEAPSAPLLQRMREVKIRAKDVQHALLSGTLARKLGAAVEGMTGELTWYPGVKGPYAALAQTVLSRSGTDMFDYPWTMSRLSAYLIMVKAVERAGAVDRMKVRAALAQGRFDAPPGQIAFGEDGVATGNGALTFQIQNGKPVIVWPPERATGKYRYPAPAWNGTRN